MKPLLLAAVWGIFPCDSHYATEPFLRMTVVYKCENTFGELAGPFLTEGWKPSPAPLPPKPVQAAASNSDQPTAKKPTTKKKKKKKRRKRA